MSSPNGGKNHAREHLDAIYRAAKNLNDEVGLTLAEHEFPDVFFEATDAAVDALQQARAALHHLVSPKGSPRIRRLCLKPGQALVGSFLCDQEEGHPGRHSCLNGEFQWVTGGAAKRTEDARSQSEEQR